MKFKVLIADDEEIQRKLERQTLSSEDFEITEASNGHEVIKLLHENEYDVLLLDKNMPEMTGDEVCSYVRNKLNNTFMPIIMVTACNSSNDLVKSLSLGATDFIRKPYNPMELRARTASAASKHRLVEQLDSAESMLYALARMVESKDGHTGDHCSRLAHSAVVFGEKLGLDDESLLALKRGGVLHDIGKLGIPDSILLKANTLNDEEWVTMKRHTVIGAKLCKGLNSIKNTIPIIECHHERWDGTGYPKGIPSEQLPLITRIVAIVDVFDALVSKRPYKDAWSQEDALKAILLGSGTQFDPDVVDVFVKLYHDGTLNDILSMN